MGIKLLLIKMKGFSILCFLFIFMSTTISCRLKKPYEDSIIVNTPDTRKKTKNNYIQTLQHDSDNDGIPDERDKCPFQPEDIDRFQDDDGCPDLDNDADGIPDKEDACPNHHGPMSNNKLKNGCPLHIPSDSGVTIIIPTKKK